ncbi:unnamed protein product, partial [marine sediment metagenome]
TTQPLSSKKYSIIKFKMQAPGQCQNLEILVVLSYNKH